MVQIAVSAEQSGSGEVKERRSSDELSDQTRLEMYRLYAEGVRSNSLGIDTVIAESASDNSSR